MMNLKFTKIVDHLKKIGINSTEVKVYLAALSIGIPQTSGVLANRSQLKSSTTSMALKSLIKKGLISSYSKDVYIYYVAEPPESLLGFLDRKQNDLEALRQQTIKLLPAIKSTQYIYSAKPKIKVFEGIEGIKKVFLDMLSLGDEILGYTSLFEVFDNPFDDFWVAYFEKVVFYNKTIKVIVPDTKKGRAFKLRDEKENRQTMLISKDKYCFETEKHIVGNTVAHISIHPDVLMAVVIEDQKMADTERKFFNLIWDTTFSEVYY